MLASGMLRLTLYGDTLYNNNVADTLRFRFKLGAATPVDETTPGTNATLIATRRAWELVVKIGNLGVLNSQAWSVAGGIFPSVGMNTGIGSLGDSTPWAGTANTVQGIYPALMAGTSAVDMSLAQTLAVTVQWSAASANDSWRKLYAVLENL